jgi:hypothetical membrane protein
LTLHYRVAQRLAIAGPLAFAAAWMTAAALQPGFRPLRDDESALAAIGAAHPWITMTGDVLLGLAVIALAIRLAGRAVTVGSALLLVAGLAIVVQAVAREDCVGSCAGAPSGHQALHDGASAVAFLLLPIAILVLSRAFRPRLSRVAGLAALLLLVVFLALSEGPHAGLGEILALLPLLAWIVTAGLTASTPRWEG